MESKLVHLSIRREEAHQGLARCAISIEDVEAAPLHKKIVVDIYSLTINTLVIKIFILFFKIIKRG